MSPDRSKSPARQYDSYQTTSTPPERTPETNSPRTTLGPHSRRNRPPTEETAPKRRRTVEEVLRELEETMRADEDEQKVEANKENAPPEVAPPTSKAASEAYARSSEAPASNAPKYGPDSRMRQDEPLRQLRALSDMMTDSKI